MRGDKEEEELMLVIHGDFYSRVKSGKFDPIRSLVKVKCDGVIVEREERERECRLQRSKGKKWLFEERSKRVAESEK